MCRITGLTTSENLAIDPGRQALEFFRLPLEVFSEADLCLTYKLGNPYRLFFTLIAARPAEAAHEYCESGKA